VFPSSRLLNAKLPPLSLREQLGLRANTGDLRGKDHVAAKKTLVNHFRNVNSTWWQL
jgi:hypothetical protein